MHTFYSVEDDSPKTRTSGKRESKMILVRSISRDKSLFTRKIVEILVNFKVEVEGKCRKCRETGRNQFPGRVLQERTMDTHRDEKRIRGKGC
jgi:archaellum component FlaG (FlaF/FlaG flagellin family)